MSEKLLMLGAGLLFAAFIAVALAAPISAAPLAQATETPTPTPTPIYTTEVALTSGNTLVVQHSWTFGELWQFVAVVALLLVDLAQIVLREVSRWAR